MISEEGSCGRRKQKREKSAFSLASSANSRPRHAARCASLSKLDLGVLCGEPARAKREMGTRRVLGIQRMRCLDFLGCFRHKSKSMDG